jgi:lactoylglutathione lyase
MEAMSHFWVDVIGLTTGKRPDFPFKGAWFYSEGKPLIHLAEQKGFKFETGSIAHVALEGANYISLIKTLKQLNYAYTEKDVPMTRERQVFISGPDGITVEMLFPQQASSKPHHSYTTNDNLEFLGENQ